MSTQEFKITIDSATAIPGTDVDYIALVRALQSMHAVVPLSWFKLIQQVGDPEKFDYKFLVVDGRLWKQVIWFRSSDGKRLMTFDVPDFWVLEEFVFHRPIRDLIIKMTPLYGITSMIATF